MKVIIKTAFAALALVAGASAGQAETVWHFPYKGTPYATQSEPTQKATAVQTVRTAKHAAGHAKTVKKSQEIR